MAEFIGAEGAEFCRERWHFFFTADGRRILTSRGPRDGPGEVRKKIDFQSFCDLRGQELHFINTYFWGERLYGKESDCTVRLAERILTVFVQSGGAGRQQIRIMFPSIPGWRSTSVVGWSWHLSRWSADRPRGVESLPQPEPSLTKVPQVLETKPSVFIKLFRWSAWIAIASLVAYFLYEI